MKGPPCLTVIEMNEVTKIKMGKGKITIWSEKKKGFK